MTRLLRQALDGVLKLSESEQDAIAAILMQEIESERRWDERFARAESQE